MRMNDLDLQRLAVGNALNQLLYRAEIAAEFDTRSGWSRLYHFIQGRFTDIVRSFVADLSGGIVRDRIVVGLSDVEIADLRETIALALSRGNTSVADLFETALSSLTTLLEDVEPQAFTSELRKQIEATVGHVRWSIRDTLLIVNTGSGRRATEFNIQLPGASGARTSNAGGVYEVWFGTNRKPALGDNGVLKGFSGERDTTQVHVGRCAVEIPVAHRIGSMGSSWWRRLLHGDDRLRLSETVELNREGFWTEIQGRLAAQPGPNDAVVFLHGYNVSFDEAAIRAAQIGADLSLPGLTAFFSWPSCGRLLSYAADVAAIEASEQAITGFLNDFCARSGARNVHLIAHSMGNRGLLRAVQRISQRVADQSKRPFGQIILAAADVDTDTFRSLASAYALVADRTTLYVSAGDRAVLGSRLLYAAARVGLTPPICVVEGIDTINVTNVDMTELGHGYVASSREVLADMFNILTSGMPPNQRATLKRATEDGVGFYWEFAC